MGRKTKPDMGIDVRWEDERGEQLAELLDKNCLVEQFLPNSRAKDFPCLRFVDPYGDTVFNCLQIPQVVIELELLLKQPWKQEVENHLRSVRDFVRQDHGVHTYIKFYGD
jgi:hypothetical protein